jgi:hypothetical protein
MERFLKRHGDRVIGILSGFDRVLFRGTLRSISYVQGMEIFLSSQHVLLKDFGRFAERVSARLKAHAEALAHRHGRPFEYLAASSQSKEDRARQILTRDGVTEGLICVLSCVEPCQAFAIRKDRARKHLVLTSQERKCLHLYFYYVDREFGLIHVRLQTWLPMTIQVCINGREWLARRLSRASIGYEQWENSFTRIDDLPRAQQLLDQLTTRDWALLLTRWARRVNPWISAPDAWPLHGYYWSIRQGEYATDVMFRDAASLAAVYPALIRQAIDHFGSDEVLRFLGRRTGPRSNGEVTTHLQRRVEGVRIKHWVEENSIKMYDKHGCVLRIETTINTPRRFKVRRQTTRRGHRGRHWVPLRKGVADLPRRVEISRAANARYLDALAVVGEPTPSHRLLDPVSAPILRDGRRYRPLHPISPHEATLFRVILRGEFHLHSFRNRDLRAHLDPCPAPDSVSHRRASTRITRRLALLRAHRLIYKVPGTQAYRITKKGHDIMNTAIAFRDTDIALLAA